MKFTFCFSDGKVLTGSVSPQEEEALILFCAVQNKLPEEYLKDIFDTAVKMAVTMVDIAGGVDAVRGVLDRQGG